MTRRCIYCLDDKDESAFNREHVIPESFGKFENNLVLDCVCEPCNSYFGRDLDLKFARDSAEGLQRFKKGLTKGAAYKSLGRRSTTRHVMDQDGMLKGAIVAHTADPDDPDSLGVELVPQVGFATASEGPYTWFHLDEIPEADELRDQGFPLGTGGCSMQVRGCLISEALDVLDARGIPRAKKTVELPAPTGAHPIETTVLIADPEFRAVTKIAFNYLAAATSPNIARMVEFNDARRYARNGVEPSERLVHFLPSLIVGRRNGPDVKGHFLLLARLGDFVVAQVSLFSTFRYAVILSEGPFTIPTDMWSGHVFDLDVGAVAQLTREQVEAAWQM